MNDLSTMTQVMTQRLRDFIYFPVTDWSDFFRPTFYFGCNVTDAATERAVLDDVGSYGKQLNRVLDALVVLIKMSDDKLATLTQEEQQAIWRLRDLHQQADEASKRAER